MKLVRDILLILAAMVFLVVAMIPYTYDKITKGNDA